MFLLYFLVCFLTYTILCFYCYFLSICLLYDAPIHQSKVLVWENLLANKLSSDSDSNAVMWRVSLRALALDSNVRYEHFLEFKIKTLMLVVVMREHFNLASPLCCIRPHFGGNRRLRQTNTGSACKKFNLAQDHWAGSTFAIQIHASAHSW